MSTIEERYWLTTAKSAAIAKRAEYVMPGGDTRSTAHHRSYSLTFTHGEGAFLFDADGNRYIDLLGNYTSLVHGNSYPSIVEAIREQAGKGAAHVARRMTGRKYILMARHGYHGSYDDLEVGLAGNEGERTTLADFGDPNAFEALLSERGKEIAAVFTRAGAGLGGRGNSAAGLKINLEKRAARIARMKLHVAESAVS